MRRRALLSGKFVVDHPPLSIDCVIRDLTDAGARLVLGQNVICRPRGWLINLQAGSAHDAIVIWRAAGLLGVKFIETVDVRMPTPGALDRLHQLWLARR